MHARRPWGLLASAALYLSACAPAPPARLTPQASAVRVGKAHPASAATVLGPVDGESGDGCMGFGTLGTYEASEADLRNRASAMGATYVEIQTVIAPRDNGTQCADSRLTIHGVAYRTVEDGPVAPSPGAPPPVTPPPANPPLPYSTPACDLTLRLAIHGTPGDALGIEVVAENTSATPLDFDLEGPCPGGIVDLVGLGAGYDYYGRCAAGACPGTPASKHVHLDVHGSDTLASTTLLPHGGPCTAPLSPGRHSLQAVAPPLGISVCSEAAVFDVAAPAPSPVTRPVAAPGH